MSPVFDAIAGPLPRGFTAIEASAGTGKTWTLSHLAVRLLLADAKLEPRQLLVITFTNAASDELAARIRRVLLACRAAAVGLPGATPEAQRLVAAHGGPACASRLEALLTSLDELGVSTIHAWCKRVLEGAAFASGEPFSADLAGDDGELIAAAVRDAWRSRLWSDAALAAAASADNWTVEKDLKVWRRWNRHAGTRIEPQVGLDVALAGLTAAVAALAQQPADLPGWRWQKDYTPEGKDLLTQGLAALARCRHLADLPDCAAGIALLAADTVARKGAFKKHAAEAAAHPLLLACQRLREALTAVRQAWLGWLCPQVRAHLDRAQASAAVRTQDDLLRRVRAALGAQPGLAAHVRARWRIALVDEFQDTDPVQWEIIRTCWPDSPLVVVGDPKQAIYRFRGADLDAYLEAVRGAAGFRLARNFRSDPHLVQAVLALIGANAEPFLDPRIALPPVEGIEDPARARLIDPDGGAPLTALLSPSETEAAARERAVADEIVRLLARARLCLGETERPLAPRDCAVLVRTRDQAQAMRDELLARGVPAAIAAHGDVLDSESARELVAVLTAVARPRDPAAVRAALATRLWGCAAAAIAALASDDARWQDLIDAFEGHALRWRRSGLAACVEALLTERGSLARLADLPDGERRLTDLRHAVEVLHTQAAAEALRPAALLAWLARRSAADESEQRRLRLDSDASAVRVLTMHVAKGLEFPVVFCPYLGYRSDHEEEGHLFAAPDGMRLVFAGPLQPLAEAVQTQHDDAEQLRLAYVALTRARLRCYVLWGRWDKLLHTGLLSALGWWLRPEGEDRATWIAASESGVATDVRAARLAASVQRLAELAEAQPQCLAVRTASALDTRWSASATACGPGELRVLPDLARARLDLHRRVTSFTGLAGGGDAAESRRGDEAAGPLPLAVEAAGLRALARGADVGDALHGALEQWDFQGDPTPLVRSALTRAGLDQAGGRHRSASDPVAVVAAGFRALAALPIPAAAGAPLILAQARLRRPEWEFHLPLARVRPARVLELIRRHDAIPAVVRAQLPNLRDAAPGGGFLRGFVDLLAGDGTRWWVIDWKSNHLGDEPAAYGESALWQAMAGHGYLVQALLYVLALHRHLRARLGDAYDYETHIAGAAWIFLRGVDVGGGVWSWRPPRALVEELDAELLR